MLKESLLSLLCLRLEVLLSLGHHLSPMTLLVQGPSSRLISSTRYVNSLTLFFSLLKATVAKWIHEVGLNGDLHADSLLMGLYRYLCGKGRTLLHDTSLFR